MAVTAVVSGNTIVINREDINRELVYPISALHTELRKRGAYTDIGLFAGEKELVRVSNWPTEEGFGNSIFSLTDPEAISTEAESTLGIAGGGGGGGSISQAQITAGMKSGLDTSDDIEAIKNRPVAILRWRVKTAHGTAPDNFTVGQELLEYIFAASVSKWRLPGSATDLSVAPTRSNLESFDVDVVAAIANMSAAVTANQVDQISKLRGLDAGDPYGAIGQPGQALTLTIPAAPLGKRRTLKALTIGYSGGVIPPGGLTATVTYGQGGVVQPYTLTDVGPAPIELGSGGVQGQVATSASGDSASPITISLPAGGAALVANIAANAV